MSSSVSSRDLQRNDMDTSGFPYQALPNEIKVPILENIHDPQDKLNILEALPLTEWLMGWDCKFLKFELVYPLVYKYLKWPYENHDTRWSDTDEDRAGANVLNLCKASPELQRIVTDHFKKYITTHSKDRLSGNHLFREYQQEQIWNNEDFFSISLRKAAWHSTLPFGIKTSFPNRIRNIANSQIASLKELGKKVWSLQVSFYDMDNAPAGLIRNIVECLHLVPNLRRLNLNDPLIYPNPRPSSELFEEPILLPNLPHLKMIKLDGICSHYQHWILPKYTCQLEVMDFYGCYLTENFKPTCFPKLERVHISSGLTSEGEYYNSRIDNVNGLLNKFLLSPLKSISVSFEEVDAPKFFNFMLTLNKFGKTLQALEIKFGKMNATTMESVEKSSLEGWISQLNFPKLMCLHLKNYVGPLGFLEKMSALKKLSIVFSNKTPLQSTHVERLHFSVKKNGVLESSIWQRFPLLEWFKIGSGNLEWVYHKKGISDGLPMQFWENY